MFFLHRAMYVAGIILGITGLILISQHINWSDRSTISTYSVWFGVEIVWVICAAFIVSGDIDE
jgi:hypothetical protein